MRILYFSDTFLPEINGVTTVLATMRDGLHARGHEVRMVVPGYGTPSPNPRRPLSRLPGGAAVLALGEGPRWLGGGVRA
jgi:hypothetical protein